MLRNCFHINQVLFLCFIVYLSFNSFVEKNLDFFVAGHYRSNLKLIDPREAQSEDGFDDTIGYSFTMVSELFKTISELFG
jgi:hypothetical protein